MKLFHIITLALFAYLLTSCEEVIEIDLNDANEALVIEGLLKDQPTGNQIQLSLTGSYFEPGNYPAVSGAQVSLTDDEGNTEILQETDAGFYPILETQAEAGRTYTLKVELNGEIYEASSTMQEGFSLDSIEFVQRAGPFVPAGSENFILVAFLTDPPGDNNFLLFETVVNGELKPDLFLYDGRQTDGNEFQVPFFTLELQKGDQVTVRTYAIDQDTYEYYNTLAELVGQGFAFNSATPANPTTNISNGALGYFGTLAQTEIEAVVP